MRCISNMRSLLSLYLPPPTFLSKPSLFTRHSVFPPPIGSTPLIKFAMARCNGGPSLAVRQLSGGRLDLDDMSKDVMGCYGDIHIIVGPMFAGKTTELLRRVKAELSNGRYFFTAFMYFVNSRFVIRGRPGNLVMDRHKISWDGKKYRVPLGVGKLVKMKYRILLKNHELTFSIQNLWVGNCLPWAYLGLVDLGV